MKNTLYEIYYNKYIKDPKETDFSFRTFCDRVIIKYRGRVLGSVSDEDYKEMQNWTCLSMLKFLNGYLNFKVGKCL